MVLVVGRTIKSRILDDGDMIIWKHPYLCLDPAILNFTGDDISRDGNHGQFHIDPPHLLYFDEGVMDLHCVGDKLPEPGQWWYVMSPPTD